MNTLCPPFHLALVTAFFILHPSSFILAQGLLTPPGAPAPTQRTLDQLETRTPISSAPFTISAGGSYYLTGNLAVTAGSAITIGADDVTLDLNGFTLSSTASPASGVAISFGSGVRENITIRNGHIRGTTTFSGGTFTPGGFQYGVRVIAFGANVRVTDLSVLGVSQTGIELNTVRTYVVERCLVEVCGLSGIRAGQVRDSSASTCLNTGILGLLVRDCFGESVSASAGGRGIEATIAINCTGLAAGGTGIDAAHATHCEATSTGTTGIGLDGVSATFCRAKRDGGIAINGSRAIGCTVNGTGTVSASGKFLGTP